MEPRLRRSVTQQSSGTRSDLLRGDTVWILARANPSDGQENVQYANATDRAAEEGMKDDVHEPRVVAEKIVILPIDGPWQIEQQSAHFEREYHQKCAINPVH